MTALQSYVAVGLTSASTNNYNIGGKMQPQSVPLNNRWSTLTCTPKSLLHHPSNVSAQGNRLSGLGMTSRPGRQSRLRRS